MRRRSCLSSQRASSLLTTWAAAHTRPHRHLSSPTAAATTGAANTAVPARKAEVHKEVPTGGEASTPTTSVTTAGESVAAATERLRTALRMLSVIEQAKSDQQKLRITHLSEQVKPIDVEPDSDEPSSTQDDQKGAIGLRTSLSAAAGHASTCNISSRSSDQDNKAAAPTKTPAAAAVPASVSWSSATSSWIRNKRPKFWALVNDAGTECGEGDDVAAHNAAKNDNAKTSRAARAPPSQARKSAAASSTPSDAAVPMREKKGKAPPSTDRSGPASMSSSASLDEKKSDTVAASSPSCSGLHSSSFSSAAAADHPSSARAASVSAASIRVTSSVLPFRSRYKKDVAHALSELLSRDPALGPQLLGQLSDESRRLMLIMGTASEYFGVDYDEVAEQIKEADTDRDNSISAKEFDAWVGHMAGLASTRRHDAPPSVSADTASVSPAAAAAVVAATTVAAGAAGTQAQTSVSASAPTAVPSASGGAASSTERATAATEAAVVPSSLAFSVVPPTGALNEATYVTTVTSGPSPHLVSPSATLARQRAEMAISTARAASARIMEVMQKDIPSSTTALSSPPLSAATRRQCGAVEAARQTKTPTLWQTPAATPSRPSTPVLSVKSSNTAAPGSAGPVASPSLSIRAAFTQASSPPPNPPSTPCVTAAAAVPATTTAAGAAANNQDPPPPASTHATQKANKREPAYIPWPTFVKIVLAAAPPFLAFGMLDNCTLVLAGGAIDNILSAKLGLTQMAAAGMGGVVSGVAGIQVHGLAERFTRAKPPKLTPEQHRSDSFLRAENVGNTLGMVVGLVLGMTPLLFMKRSTHAAEEEEAEHQRFHEEAARSHHRQCKKTEKAESQGRQALEKEERAAREAMTKDYKAAS